jgi:uncharacterized protein (TIGR00304 family)
LIDLALAGAFLVVAGIVVVLLAFFLSEAKNGSVEVKGGGVIMIGPVPIVFGSDAKWTSIAIVLAIALILIGLLYYVI